MMTPRRLYLFSAVIRDFMAVLQDLKSRKIFCTDNLLNQKRGKGEVIGNVRAMWKTQFYGYTVDRDVFLKVSILQPWRHNDVREVLEETYDVQNGFFNYVNQFFSGSAYSTRIFFRICSVISSFKITMWRLTNRYI